MRPGQCCELNMNPPLDLKFVGRHGSQPMSVLSQRNLELGIEYIQAGLFKNEEFVTAPLFFT